MLSTGSEFSLSGLLNPNLCAASAGVSSVFWYFLLFKIFQVASGFLHAFLVLFCFVLFCFRTTVLNFPLHIGFDFMGFREISESHKTIIGKVVHC